jgi:hypothetical protein
LNVTADDGNGGVETATFELTVNNVAPSVSAGNAIVTVNEAETAQNSGTFSDPGTDDVTLSASIGTITQDDGNAGDWT